MWKYQNVNITADNLPDNKFGFIYMFTLTKNCKIDGKLYKEGTIYIGKKQLNFKRRKLITLKQKRLDPSLKRRKYEYIVKASDWETYYSSSESSNLFTNISFTFSGKDCILGTISLLILDGTC